MMIRSRTVFRSAACLLAASACVTAFGENEDPEKVIHQAPLKTLPLIEVDQEPDVIVPITLSMPHAFRQNKNVFRMPGPDDALFLLADMRHAIRHFNDQPGPFRVGVARNYDVVGPPGVRRPSVAMGDVIRTSLGDGLYLWTMAVGSDGSHGVRVQLTDVNLRGGSMVIYGLRDHEEVPFVASGPYHNRGPSGTGELWTRWMPGDVAYIEVVGEQRPSFEVVRVVHFDHDVSPSGGLDLDGDGSAAGEGPLPCHLDAMCHSENSTWAAVRDATGRMGFINQDGQASVCSGTLINTLDPSTNMPYFLTADHCLNTQAEVNSLEVTWFFQTNACNGSVPSLGDLPSTVGGTLLATNSANDMTFIRLTNDLPSNISFAGWTTETSIVGRGFHHPAGSWKRAVYNDPVGICPTCLCFSGTQYDYFDVENGLIEGGSSGSGMFNSSGQLAGQLRGLCGVFQDPEDNLNCSNIDRFWTVYGEFQETFPVIQWWLEVGGTLHVDISNPFTGDGSPGDPFKFIGHAYNAAWNGVNINIKAGVYPEAFVLQKELTLIADGGVVTIGEW